MPTTYWTRTAAWRSELESTWNSQEPVAASKAGVPDPVALRPGSRDGAIALNAPRIAPPPAPAEADDLRVGGCPRRTGRVLRPGGVSSNQPGIARNLWPLRRQACRTRWRDATGPAIGQSPRKPPGSRPTA